MPQSNSNKPKIYIYKMTADNGGAPCIKNGLISLCICKPNIRRIKKTAPSATVGDWIIGMGGAEERLAGRLIYIMQVKNRVKGQDYYKPDGKYWNRPDCIYEWDGKDYKWKEGAEYHQNGEQLLTDLGNPPKYENADCLLGDTFAYFGDGKKKNPDITKIRYIYKGLPRDFKRKHDPADYQNLDSYIKCVLDKFGYGKHSNPTDSDKSKKCNESDDDIIRISSDKTEVVS